MLILKYQLGAKPLSHSRAPAGTCESLSIPLFEDRIQPTWLPDETLFSLCSRLHRLSGRGRDADTARMLFGGPTRGFSVDLPGHLDHFVATTGAGWGTLETLAMGRTLLPFHLVFMSPNGVAEALEVMGHRGIDTLKRRSGWSANGCAPLKACAACLKFDRESFGTGYWHREHQWNGVWICPTHGARLQYSKRKAGMSSRFAWQLPDVSDLVDPDWGIIHDESLHRAAAIAIGYSVAGASQRLPPGSVCAAYRSRLILRSYASTSGRLRRSECVSALRGRLAEFESAEPFRSWSQLSDSQLLDRLMRLVSPTRTPTHPASHAWFVLCLFDGWDDFLEVVRNPQSVAVAALAQGARSISTVPHQRERLVELVCRQGHSITAAAKSLRIDVKTAMAWAAESGIKAKARPRSIHADRRADIIKSLAQGDARTAIAHRLAVSVESVDALLRSTPGLKSQRRIAIYERDRDQRRATWLTAIRGNRRCGINFVRALEPAAYAWLRRNDADWLKDINTARLECAVRSTGRSVDWNARDTQLAREVMRAMSELVDSSQRHGLRLFHLVDRLPRLHYFLRSLDRLPRTRRALDPLIRRT